MSSARILIADDDPKICHILVRALKGEPWIVEVAGDGCEALDRLGNGNFDLAFLDVKMPGLNGLEVLEAIQKKGTRTDIVMITGYGTIEVAVRAMKLGARDFFTKPIQLADFISTTRNLLERRHLPPYTLAGRLDTFLKERSPEPSLKLSDLCSHFRISPRYASKLFREHIGESFRRRLSYFRVQQARELIESTDIPLYHVSEQCGFKNYHRLTEAFHRHEGMPPGKYRKVYSDSRSRNL